MPIPARQRLHGPARSYPAAREMSLECVRSWRRWRSAGLRERDASARSSSTAQSNALTSPRQPSPVRKWRSRWHHGGRLRGCRGGARANASAGCQLRPRLCKRDRRWARQATALRRRARPAGRQSRSTRRTTGRRGGRRAAGLQAAAQRDLRAEKWTPARLQLPRRASPAASPPPPPSSSTARSSLGPSSLPRDHGFACCQRLAARSSSRRKRRRPVAMDAYKRPRCPAPPASNSPRPTPFLALRSP